MRVVGIKYSKWLICSILSVHVNWPGGFEGSTWPTHDPVGFLKAEESMVRYGRANFSEGFVLPISARTDLTAP